MSNTSRREFLAASGMTLAYAAGASARPGPNDTINLGLIGCGARAKWFEVPEFLKLGARWVAVCDVNSKNLADVRQRAGSERVAAYKDFRKLLEDKTIDVVVVATNQHWHVLATIAACQAGKDVYVEKPMGNCIGEGRPAIEAARKYNRIVQIGTQQRSQEHFQKAVQVVQSGRLGDISEVKVWDYENQSPGPGSPPDCDPPPELDWDFYVGPAPWRAYNPNIYYKYGYDWFKVSGGGHQVAWGVHHFDIVLWAMGVQWPQAVSAMGGNYAFEVFLDNVRQRRQPAANLMTGHHATNVGHLMNISWEAGRSIRWDGEKEQVVGDPEANKLVMKPYRAPWKLRV